MQKGNVWTGFTLSNVLRSTMDEVAIYDYALSGTRIQAHYEAAALPEPTACVLLMLGMAGLTLIATPPEPVRARLSPAGLNPTAWSPGVASAG